jgi:hypothetical protein
MYCKTVKKITYCVHNKEPKFCSAHTPLKSERSITVSTRRGGEYCTPDDVHGAKSRGVGRAEKVDRRVFRAAMKGKIESLAFGDDDKADRADGAVGAVIGGWFFLAAKAFSHIILY